MIMDPNSSNAILIRATTGRRKNSLTPVEVLAGTLLSFVEEKEVKSKIDFVFDVLDADKHIRVTCNASEFRSISPLITDLLRPIPTCKERLEVYIDSEWLDDGSKLKVGDPVFVKLKGEESELPGVLKFKGSEVPDSKGIYFGVELKVKKGRSDGSFRRKRFFTTEQDYAVFLALNKIRKSQDGWHKSTRSRVDENGENFYQQQETVVQCNLRLGDRVVWVKDEGPEMGTVQWIGHLPDEPGDNITVGVAFDNPIGTGTGKYKDKRLFYTRQGHASLIPLMCLIKEEDFEHPDNLNGYEEGESTASAPKIGGLSQVAMETWTVDDVSTWLVALGLTEYTANFRAHAIDGKELLTLTDSDLMSVLAVGPLGHRNKILRERTAEQQAVISGKRTEQNSVPNEFLCPITLELMRNPVIAADGYTYDRQAIVSWITREPRSPMTNVLLTSTEVTPNLTLKMMMHKFLDSA